jgi:adenine-specific DNA-methyltransferase
MNIQAFQNNNFINGLKSFFKDLKAPINYIDDQATTAKEILKDTYKENDIFQLINEVYFVGMVDDAAFEGNESLDKNKIKSDYDGVLIFGVTLKQRENNLLPTRSQLAEISRAFNREFYYTPAIVVFKYSDTNKEYLAFANTERLKYKQGWREGEKAGKVTLLRDIDINNTHRGHLDILNKLQLSDKGTKKVDSFDKLYKYWQEVFSVSVLNKKFYQDLSNWYFWAIKQVRFPNEPTFDSLQTLDQKKLDEAINEHQAKNVIRLLTRLLFTWFIKEKGLIPEELFDLKTLQDKYLNDISPLHEENTLFDSANKESIYYKAILQNLFFASLNCPILADGSDTRERGFRGNESYGKHRGVDHLMRYEKEFKDPQLFLKMMNETVPFLNGGLFECLDDKLNNIYIDGFSDQMTKGEQLIVPDYLFFGADEKVDLSVEYGSKNKKFKESAVKGLIPLLNSYKFTITENTPIEEDVALDPELLGKVFENLLASYNPETKTTARKQTGSFYTPREIVNYMVDESLIAYLKNQIKTNKTEEQWDADLHTLFSFDNSTPKLETETKASLIKSLDKCTILDPACGSGAFPMGILQKMVHVLQKLDPSNELWQEYQLEKAQDESAEVFKLQTKEEREERLKEINNAFDESLNHPDYARKLFLIENCIYGLDIQPIATQISKLRFFISLVVDQKNSTDSSNNFNVRPLPNLETKFVTANTLIGIEKENNLFSTKEIKDLEQQLKTVRHKLFNAKTPKTKHKYREADESLRQQIADKLTASGFPLDEARKLATWNPYNQNASSPFFDAEWMFDIKDGFDVVIGNPPYVQLQSVKEESKIFEKIGYKTYSKSGDLYCLFYEVGFNLLDKQGVLTYITSNKWMRAGYGKNLREYFKNQTAIHQIIDFGDSPIFENATTYTNILIGSSDIDSSIKTSVWDLSVKEPKSFNLRNVLKQNDNFSYVFDLESYLIIDENDLQIKKIIENKGTPIKNWKLKISYGLKTGFNEAFIISSETKDKLVEEDPNSIDLLKPILRGKDIKKYKADYKDSWMIVAHYESNKLIKTKYHAIYNHLKQYEKQLKARGQCTNRGGKGQHHWLEIDNNPSQEYLQRFEQPKIVWAEIVYDSAFYYDEENIYQEATGFLMIGDSLKYLIAMLNSKPVTYFFKKYYAGGDLRGNTFRYKKAFLEQLPIPIVSKEMQKKFEILSDLSKFIFERNITNVKDLILKITDSIVLNTYFPEHMQEHKIDVINHIENDLEKVMRNRIFNTLNDLEKGEVVEQLYSIWSHPDNEVRNRIALFAVRSPEILKPILES